MTGGPKIGSDGVAAQSGLAAEEASLPDGMVDSLAGTIARSLEDATDPSGPLASLDDMRVTRDDSGRIEPMRRRTVWESHVIEFRPLTYRDRNRYRLDQRGLLELDDEERLELLRLKVIRPDFSGVDSLDDFGWTTIDDILTTIQLFSRDRRRKDLPRPLADGESPSEAAGKD